MGLMLRFHFAPPPGGAGIIAGDFKLGDGTLMAGNSALALDYR